VEANGSTATLTPQPTATASTFVSVPEFCRHTGFDPLAVRRSLEGSALPGIRVGTAWRIPGWVLTDVLAGRDPLKNPTYVTTGANT
jgi:hypothetical protein